MLSSKFKKIIKNISDSKSKFLLFDKKSKKGIYLRFDVDLSINNAFEIAKFLKKKKIYANFFFQPNNGFYNIFNQKNKNIINEIYQLGHLTGLHIDEKFFSIKEKNVIEIINFFKNNNYKLSNVISFHRPSSNVLGKSFKKIINTYDKKFFNYKNYLSDSGKNNSFEKDINSFLNKDLNIKQILMHPIWWTNLFKVEEIYSELSYSCKKNLDFYLLNNFYKVFSKVIPKKNYFNKL